MKKFIGIVCILIMVVSSIVSSYSSSTDSKIEPWKRKGSISYVDKDLFKYTVKEDGLYKIYTKGTIDTKGKLLDWRKQDIGISSDNSEHIEGKNFFIQKQMFKDEVYYIEVTGNSNGRYELYVELSKNKSPYTKPWKKRAYIYNDTDTFRYKVKKDGLYKIYTKGSTDTNGSLLDWRRKDIGISNDNSEHAEGKNFFIQKQMFKDEVYYVKVGGNSLGKYELYIEEYSELDRINDVGFDTHRDATEIEIEQTHTDRINSSNDIDYFKFIVPENGYYCIYTTGTNDTKGSLLDWAGKLLIGMTCDNDTINAEGRNFYLQKEMVKDEVYYIKVTGNIGYYTIHAESSDLWKKIMKRAEEIAPYNRPYVFNCVEDCYGFVRQVWNPILMYGARYEEDFKEAYNTPNKRYAIACPDQSKNVLPRYDYGSYGDSSWARIDDWNDLVPGDILATHKGHAGGVRVGSCIGISSWHGGLYAGKDPEGNHLIWDCSSSWNGAYKREYWMGGFKYYYKPTHEMLKNNKIRKLTSSEKK